MDDKEIEVRCPCCEALLVIDVRTRKVLKHAPKGQLDETGQPVLDPGRWDQAQARVQGRLGQAQDAFDSALAKEQRRGKDLDALFDAAKRKVDRRGRAGEDGDAG